MPSITAAPTRAAVTAARVPIALGRKARLPKIPVVPEHRGSTAPNSAFAPDAAGAAVATCAARSRSEHDVLERDGASHEARADRAASLTSALTALTPTTTRATRSAAGSIEPGQRAKNEVLHGPAAAATATVLSGRAVAAAGTPRIPDHVVARDAADSSRLSMDTGVTGVTRCAIRGCDRGHVVVAMEAV